MHTRRDSTKPLRLCQYPFPAFITALAPGTLGEAAAAFSTPRGHTQPRLARLRHGPQRRGRARARPQTEGSPRPRARPRTLIPAPFCHFERSEAPPPVISSAAKRPLLSFRAQRSAPSCHFERSEAQSRNLGPTPVSDSRPMGTRVSSHSARLQPTMALDSSAAVGMTVGSARAPSCHFERSEAPPPVISSAAKRSREI